MKTIFPTFTFIYKANDYDDSEQPRVAGGAPR